MKPYILSAALLLSGAFLNAKTPIASEITPRGGWEKTDENTFGIQCKPDMQGTASLELKAAVKPETFYVLEWEAKGVLTANKGQAQFLLTLDRTVFPGFEVDRQWNLCRNYFYSGKKDSVIFSIYLRRSHKQELEIRNLKLLELSKQDCEKGFLFDFEKDTSIPAFWTRSWGQKKFAASIVKSDFINGDKSMKLVSDGTAETSISSGVFPVIAGAKYKISFWAKGSANGSLLFIFNSNNQRLSGNQPPINLLRKHCAIETEWKEYSFETTYPTDLKKYPTAAIPMANIVFFSKIPEVLIDNIKVEPAITKQE